MTDSASILARIDTLLRDGRPPPDRVLEKACAILEKARKSADGPQSSSSSAVDDDDFKSSVGSSASTSSAMTASRRTALKTMTASARSAASSVGGPLDDDDLGFMSLQLNGRPDPKQVKMLARHQALNHKPIVNIREAKTKQFQALLDGRGGKYIHADYVNNGATQIGGCTSMTPSMMAGPIEGQFGAVTSKIAEAGPPRIRNLPSDFKLA